MKSRSCKLFFKLLLLISFLLVLISFFHHIPTLLSPTPTPLFPTEALPTKTGYLSVNPTTSSAVFYAFYEAQNPISPLSETPLIIWLLGGPGCSSMEKYIWNCNEEHVFCVGVGDQLAMK
ncbi:serine carboxypeptidase-like 50 [Quercus suber]|uniref:Serine carboxypeptidase-like 50 n=1 Tax=Quercus suber TaxID=58331 RepID=A0AAW0L4F0_QUESU